MLRTINRLSNPYYHLQAVCAGARVIGPGAIVFTRNERTELHVSLSCSPNGRYTMTYQIVENGYHLYPHSIGGASISTLMAMLPGLVDRQLSVG